MDYSLFTEQQVQRRYNSLPDNLRDILDSESVIENTRQICRAHYLDEDKALIVEQLMGLIILGFVSVDELSQEIQENIHLNHRHADEFSQEIDKKIFSPIKNDLEKVYAPPTEEVEKPIVSEIKKKEKTFLDNLVEMPADKTGLSVDQAGAPVVMPSVEAPVVSPVEPPKIIPAEEEKKEEIKPVVAPAPLATELPGEENPFMLHEETKFKPFSETETKKSLGGLFGFLRKKQGAEKASPVKAQVEFGVKEQNGISPIAEITEIAKEEKTKEPLTAPKAISEQFKPESIKLEIAESKLIAKIGKPFGSLLNIFTKKEKVFKEIEVSPQSLSPEQAKVRVVHYTEFKSPVTPSPEVKQEKIQSAPGSTRPALNVVEGLTTGQIEKIEGEKIGLIEIKPPAASKLEPPENLPLASEVKPFVADILESFKPSPVEPPVVSPSTALKASRVELIKEKFQEKPLEIKDKIQPAIAPGAIKVESQLEAKPFKTESVKTTEPAPPVLNEIKPPKAPSQAKSDEETIDLSSFK